MAGRLDPDKLRGEITLVIGPGAAQEADPDEVRRLVYEGLAAGELKPSALAKQVAGATGLGREEVYQIILESREQARARRGRGSDPRRHQRGEPQERRLLVANSLGLHARAAAKITEAVSHFDCQVTLHKGRGGGRRLQRALHPGLDAPKGSLVTARAQGPQAAEALNALDKLFAGLFGEGR